MAYIYKIINDINDRVYIGKTERDIQTRFKEHCRDYKRQDIKNRPLYRAMRKYGIEHFQIKLIEETDSPNEKEIYWIQYYNSYHNGYNATLGGDGMCIYNYDLILSSLQENPSPKAVAAKIGCSVDVVYSVARKNNIQVINPSQQNLKDKALPVHQYDKKTKQYIQSFNSNVEAGIWCYENGYTLIEGKATRNHIGEVARGKRKTAYGFIWSYELKEKLD